MEAMIDFFTADNLIFLLQGAGKSLLLAACALIFGLILGVLGAAAKISKHKILRIIGNIYVELIRGTPMLLQILFLYIAFIFSAIKSTIFSFVIFFYLFKFICALQIFLR